MQIRITILMAGVAWILVPLTASAIYAGKLYTWTDAKGIVHITDAPPPDNAAVQDMTPYTEKSPQEQEAIARQKQQLREAYEQFEKREAARQAERRAAAAEKEAAAALKKAQQLRESTQVYERRVGSGSRQQTRRQFRQNFERLRRQTEASRAEAEAAAQQAEAAARKARTAAGEAGEQ